MPGISTPCGGLPFPRVRGLTGLLCQLAALTTGERVYVLIGPGLEQCRGYARTSEEARGSGCHCTSLRSLF